MKNTAANKTDVIQKYAKTKDDKTLLARLFDKLELSGKNSVFSFSPFLDLRQQILAKRALDFADAENYMFYGGSEESERKVALFFPPRASRDDAVTEENSPLAFLSASFDKSIRLSHRDFLGSIMACGVARETVGDITVSDGFCNITVLKSVERHLTDSLNSAGAAKLSVSRISRNELSAAEAEYKLIKTSLASLRLDSLVASGFALSREKAANLIVSGKVILNYEPVGKPDKAVSEGDVVSARGLGKFVFSHAGGNTRKGRTAVEIKRYV